jgi:hypothetical protein
MSDMVFLKSMLHSDCSIELISGSEQSENQNQCSVCIYVMQSLVSGLLRMDRPMSTNQIIRLFTTFFSKYADHMITTSNTF